MGNYNKSSEIEDFVIIGGGVAGLSVANHLLDFGKIPIMIDAGYYPSHKVCGEFFSPECHPILEKWGVLPPELITQIRFCVGKHTHVYPLPSPARGGSRYWFDDHLMRRAKEQGAQILTQTWVEKITNDRHGVYNVHLHTGEVIDARHLFIGTGRVLSLLQSQPKPKNAYVGIKAHFEGIEMENTLEMHLFPRAYLGVSPIEEGKVNIACLAKIQEIEGCGTAQDFIYELAIRSENCRIRKLLEKGSMIYSQWMQVEVPAFQQKNRSTWKNVYLIGDAATSIEPATGDGLAMAITSGVLAAEHASNGDWESYQQAWDRTYSKRLRWGRLLHWLMQHPYPAKAVLHTINRFPSLLNYFYSVTRD